MNRYKRASCELADELDHLQEPPLTVDWRVKKTAQVIERGTTREFVITRTLVLAVLSGKERRTAQRLYKQKDKRAGLSSSQAKELFALIAQAKTLWTSWRGGSLKFASKNGTAKGASAGRLLRKRYDGPVN